jgi:YidC/Oxa1 family membrane protein insertase
MERRTLVAIALSFLVLYGYQYFFVPPPAEQAEQASGGQASGVRPQASAEAPGNQGAGNQPVTPAAATPAVIATPAAPATPQGTVVVGGEQAGDADATIDTQSLIATFSNRGGRLTHWRLKSFLDPAGNPVDLIPTNLPAGQPSPFELRVDDEALTTRINSAIYRQTLTRGTADGQPHAVVFEFQDAAGLAVRKEYRVEPTGYIVSFSATVRNGDQALNPTVLWGPGLSDIGSVSGGGSFFTGNYVQPPQAIFNVDAEMTRIAGSDLNEQPVHEGRFKFVGIDDHYFLAAALDPGQTRAEFHQLALPGDGEDQRLLVTQTLRFAQPPQNVRFFIGPKQDSVLRGIDIELVKSINFGIFAWLARPLLNGLNWIHGYVGNYGWSIILLTIAINIAMFPLRHKTVVSMRKMQALQPQMKAIQDRYKDLKMTDPAKQKMNTEVMNLYREKGVNPASGCVPMLLTMPVLIAFYSLLSQAIELRDAPFALWIRDLSQPDPYYVTPLLMGASMFWQQKITPSTADPQQQKVMLIMPVIFTGMFLAFPSGLNIYYFVSNLWTIGQQYFTNWMIGPAIVSAPRPPAERKLKNVGSGKTPDAK